VKYRQWKYRPKDVARIARVQGEIDDVRVTDTGVLVDPITTRPTVETRITDTLVNVCCTITPRVSYNYNAYIYLLEYE